MKSAGRPALTEDGRAICALVRSEIVRVGWSEIARRSGMDRTALHRAFPPKGDRNPSFRTMTSVADAVGLEFTVRRKAPQ